MAVLISVVPQTLGVRPVSNAAKTNPQVGGVRQRKVRLGSHFRMEGSFPPLYMDDGRSHAADILACEYALAQIPVPQPELVIGTPGATLVNGAGQTGTTLTLDGATAGYVFKKGQLFNYIGSQHVDLYSVQAQATANGAGQVTLSIWPMLRVTPPDNMQLNFLNPVIEGWLEIGGGWDVTPDFTVQTSFSIEEAR